MLQLGARSDLIQAPKKILGFCGFLPSHIAETAPRHSRIMDITANKGQTRV